MSSHDRLPRLADFLEARAIGVDVDDVAGQPRDIWWPRAIAGEDREDVLERLRELAGQGVGREGAGLIPADDAGGKDQPAACRHGVGIALRPRPTRGTKRLHGRNSFNRSRAMIWRCTSLAPS